MFYIVDYWAFSRCILSFRDTSKKATFYISLFFVFSFSLFTAGQVYAQRSTIRGFVTDQENGAPMELVNVTVSSARTSFNQGTVTSRDGLYVFPRLQPDTYVIKASFVGYSIFSDTLIILAGQTTTRNIALIPSDEVMEEVLIEAENLVGNARITAGQQTLTPKEIELIPSPDLSGDLVNMLTSLPGIVALGDRGGQLFVRGGEPSQNLVLLDGMLLYQPFHILGFYSAFPTEIINRTDVYAGGFTSKYGERISSVIEVDSRNGNTQKLAGSVALSPFVGALRAEGPIIKNNLSLLASFRQSLVEQGGERLINTSLPFNFGDAFVKLNGNIKNTTRLSATFLHTYDRGELGVETVARSPDEVNWRNTAAGARLLTIPAISPVMLDVRVSYSKLINELGPRDTPDRVSSISNWNFSLDATFFGPNANIDAGVSTRLVRVESELGGLYQNIEVEDNIIEHAAVYAEPEFRVGEHLRIRPGLRIQFFDIQFNPFLEPRLRVIYQKDKHQLSGALGKFNQAILGLNDRRDAASIFTVWTNVPRPSLRLDDVREGRAQSAFHSLLGYQYSPTASIDFSIEGYYKKLSNLFLAEWTAFPRLTTNLQPGEGTVFGFDTRLEMQVGSLYGYVNYGYTLTEYEAKQESLILWYGTSSLKFNPPHDRRHQVSALVSGSVKEYDFSVRWAFGSGLPFSQAAGFDGFILIDDVLDVLDEPKSRRVIYEEPFNARLPTYHRLDLSIDRTFQLRSADLTLQASVINVYNRKNLFFLDIFTLRRVDQLPIFPSFGLKLEF